MFALAKKYRKQKGGIGGAGETMIDLTTNLIIVSIMGGIAFGVYKWATATSEWNALNGLVSSVRRTYQGETYPATGIAAALITNQDIGSLRSTGGTAILNTYGQDYTIAGAGGSFTISDPGVLQADCNKILKQIPSTGYLSVTVNGGTAITTFPITVAEAQGACNVATNAGNTILVEAQ